MLIKEINQYLSKHTYVDAGELSFHLRRDKEIVRHALRFMKKKGLVKEVKPEHVCKGCSCSSGMCTDATMYMKI